MLKLLQMAWSGWRDFTTDGKLPALLLVLLLFLWVRRKKEGAEKPLLFYTTGITFLCILPFSAVLFMLYQTKFYDYEWIWSLVPMTAMIGMGGVFLLEDCFQQLRDRNVWVRVFLVVALCGIPVLCSGFGSKALEISEEAQERAQAQTLYAYLEETISEQPIRIWAPKEVLTYSRVGWVDCIPLYGRNLWDKHLNAYTYDTYSVELEQMQLWMDGDLERGDWTDEECASYLAETEVNCIVLPTRLAKAVGIFEQILGTTARQQGEYYILIR